MRPNRTTPDIRVLHLVPKDLPMKATDNIVDPKLVRTLRATLAARGIRNQDLDDAVADIQVRVLERLRVYPPPQDFAGWTKLCNAIAVAYAADAHRASRRHGRFHLPLVGDADDYAHEEADETAHGDPVDRARLAELLQTHVAESHNPDLAFAILEGVANGATHAELSKELGVSEDAIGHRLAGLRKGFRARLK